MAALRRVLAGHGFELDLCWSQAMFGVAGHLDPGPAASLAGESWALDLLDEVVVDGLAGAQEDELGTVENVWDQGGLEQEGGYRPPVAVSQPELALGVEAGPVDAAEGVEDGEEGGEDNKEFLMHGLRDVMLDACASLGPLVDVVACVAETRQVVIREVEGGTAGGQVPGTPCPNRPLSQDWS